MILRCPACGQDLRAQSRFCPHCGRPLDGRLAPGTALSRGDFRIVRSISKGGMGAVYLAEDNRAFGRLCVVKQMLEYYDASNPEECHRAEQRFQEEGRTLASLSYPGIPQMYAFFEEEDRFYLAMEYIQGDDLETFVTHEDDAGRIVTGRRLPRERWCATQSGVPHPGVYCSAGPGRWCTRISSRPT
jgi:serine/threonine-protein kinase